MNNAVFLYSDKLNGLIRTACQRSLEFHFPEFEEQMNAIQLSMIKLCSSRLSKPAGKPIPGDIFISKHSNLVDLTPGFDFINVIFHVVVDEESPDSWTKMTSLNCSIPPYLMNALHVILRLCFQYNITTISLPLFLTSGFHSKKMDSTTRLKKAEMIIKAIKGILTELTTWKGEVLNTIQFLVPSEMDTEELKELSSLVPKCFQIISHCPFD
ncbi:hypothetical protein Ciccas_006412 [Cichlidogyrus casuarinus]|uniref:Uncharacterized protein n=1 Tax=Cichlidogyrus casuarinus TaxID=1844966 RepID=A0ABD2Q684_9PLAT